MIRRALLACTLMLIAAAPLAAQEAESAAPRHLTLDEAVQLALVHNHVVRIARYQVDEKTHAKDVARSAYFPLLRNDSSVIHLTDTQFIAIPQGELGTVGGTPIPARTAVISQGALDIFTSGTSLTQPLLELVRVRPANDVAAAELSEQRGKQRDTENQIVLKVRQLYYRVLVLESEKAAMAAKQLANEDVQKERVQQVKYGASLEEQEIESRAQLLQAKQDVLTNDLQLSDATLQLNDALGLPLATPLSLDPTVPAARPECARDECLRIAQANHPEIAEAQAKVDQASAAVRLAKRQYVPDLEAFARYSYADNVPFLARNFGAFGAHFGWDLFDGGKRNAEIAERKAQLDQAQENLTRVKDEVDLRVRTAYNKLERTRELMKVSEELLATRTESRRVAAQELQQGAALQSQADAAAAKESEAKTMLLQSQLDYAQSADELATAIGQRAE